MIQLGIKSNVDEISKAFSRGMERQVPFATSLALNIVAQKAKENLRGEMQRVFDRPTPWTLNSLFVKNSSKRTLTATVGHKDRVTRGMPAGNYLKAQILGGKSDLTPFERLMGANRDLIPAPSAARDRFGAISKKLMDSIVDSVRRPVYDPRGVFIIRPGDRSHLEPGIYQRVPIKTKTKRFASGVGVSGGGSRLKPLMLFKDQVGYSQRYDLEGVVGNTVKTSFDQAFMQAMDRALSSAK